LNAVVFLYESVLSKPLGEMTGLKRVQQRHRVPVVLTKQETKAVLGLMEGTTQLMSELIYGAGLRVHECVTLRVKDVDLGARTVNIRDSKGSKDRTSVLPAQLCGPLEKHLLRVAILHKEDLAQGAGLAPMPNALAKKYPSASSTFSWQFVFRPPYCGPGVTQAEWCAGTRQTQRPSGHLNKLYTEQGFISTRVSIRFVTAFLRICWLLARTSEQSSYAWVIAAFKRR